MLARIGQSVAQQKLAEPLAPPLQIVPRIVTRPGEVAHGLLTGRRGTHVGQHPRPLQFRELPGIATVRLNAVARLAGDQGRRNDVAAHSAEMQLPVQGVAARPRFVATLNGPRRKTGRLTLYYDARMLKRDMFRSYALIGAQARLAELDRERVDILEGTYLLDDPSISNAFAIRRQSQF